MAVIDQILKQEGYTLDVIKKYEEQGICNGCGGKGGFHITGLLDLVISNLENFDISKEEKLINNLNIVCDIHDIDYNKGGGLLDYLKANYKLAINICKLIYRTNKRGRMLVFLLILLGTTLFGWKYFNWKIFNYVKK